MSEIVFSPDGFKYASAASRLAAALSEWRKVCASDAPESGGGKSERTSHMPIAGYNVEHIKKACYEITGVTVFNMPLFVVGKVGR